MSALQLEVCPHLLQLYSESTIMFTETYLCSRTLLATDEEQQKYWGRAHSMRFCPFVIVECGMKILLEVFNNFRHSQIAFSIPIFFMSRSIFMNKIQYSSMLFWEHCSHFPQWVAFSKKRRFCMSNLLLLFVSQRTLNNNRVKLVNQVIANTFIF